MQILGIIPARYGSTRFPGKPLVKIGDKTMIKRVYEQAKKAFDHVLVATDDERIYNEIASFNGNVVYTSMHHTSGTDRCAEALKIYSEKIGKVFDVVVNIQGDEPFIKPEQLKTLASAFENNGIDIATLIKITNNADEIFSENTAKVLLNTSNNAIYFSRTPIPFLRGIEKSAWAGSFSFYKHIGVYAYKAEVLLQITRLPESTLELAEKLEQNRWIENGYTIKTVLTEFDGIAVDTADDLQRIISQLSMYES